MLRPALGFLGWGRFLRAGLLLTAYGMPGTGRSLLAAAATPPPAPSPTPLDYQPSGSSGLQGWQIVLIVVLVFAFAVALALALLVYVYRHYWDDEEPASKPVQATELPDQLAEAGAPSIVTIQYSAAQGAQQRSPPRAMSPNTSEMVFSNALAVDTTDDSPDLITTRARAALAPEAPAPAQLPTSEGLPPSPSGAVPDLRPLASAAPSAVDPAASAVQIPLSHQISVAESIPSFSSAVPEQSFTNVTNSMFVPVRQRGGHGADGVDSESGYESFRSGAAHQARGAAASNATPHPMPGLPAAAVAETEAPAAHSSSKQEIEDDSDDLDFTLPMPPVT